MEREPWMGWRNTDQTIPREDCQISGISHER